MRLEFVRRGSGPPLLLIHGIGGEWRAWEPLMDRLAEERELVAIDAPGFGGSGLLPPGRRPAVPELARAIAEFVRDEVGHEPIEVAGHSMGGWIALELAKLGVASRVTAVAPSGFWSPREAAWSRGSLRLTVWVSRNGGEVLERALRSPWARRVLLATQFARPDRVPAERVLRINEVLRGSAGFDDTLVAMTADRFSGDPPIGVPVTIVWGTRDGLLLPRQARRAQREIPGAKLVWIDGGGHFAHWDDQETAVRAVLGR